MSSTNNSNPFINEANDFVKREIDLRIQYYTSGIDNSLVSRNAYNFLYKKTSWAILRSLKRVDNNVNNGNGTTIDNNLTSGVKGSKINLRTPIKPYFNDATTTSYSGRSTPTEEYIATIDNNIEVSYTKDFYVDTEFDIHTDNGTTVTKSGGPGSISVDGLDYQYDGNDIIPYMASIPNIYDRNGNIKVPLLQSVDITNEGQFSLLQKATITFLVFDKNQLSKYVDAYLKPGKLIEVLYGWSVYEDNPNARQGQFRGVINTYNWSLNDDGSFTCTLSAIAKSGIYGSLLASLKHQGKSTGINPKIPTEFPIRTLNGFTLADILSNLDMYRTSLFENYPGDESTNKYKHWKFNPSNKTEVTGFVIYKLDIAFNHITSTSFNIKSSQKGEYELQTYIRLDSLIHIINCIIESHGQRGLFSITNEISLLNKMHLGILRTGPADFTHFVFPTELLGTTFDNGITISRDQSTGKIIRSATFSNTEMRSALNFTVPSIIDEFIVSSDALYIGALLINVQWLKYQILNLQEFDINAEGYRNVLDRIFKQLNIDTGGLIDLSINEIKGFLVVTNHKYSSDKIKNNLNKLMIPAISKNSIVRGLDMSAQIPSPVAAAIAIMHRSNDKSLGEGKIITNDEINKIKDDFLLNLEFENANFASYIPIVIKNDIADAGKFSEYQSRVKGLYSDINKNINDYILSVPAKNNAFSSIIDSKTATVPIKLKFILDGINGFDFGNVLTTNWLPNIYVDDSIIFTVGRIHHKIENHDWITEIECYYRLI